MRFDGKVVVITGASRGIGAESARLFGAEGATVVITYKSNRERAEESLAAAGGKGMVIQADFGNSAEIANVFGIVEREFRNIDVLVNNVGISKMQEFKTLPLADWNLTFATNVTGMFLSCQAALPMIRGGGSIVNISSIRGLPDHGRPPILDYSTSKAAVISLTKTLAKALAPQIRVNCISPGMTNTDVTKSYTREALDQFIKGIYLERLIEPMEVAKAIVFLASGDASGITGVNLPVDGGQSLSR